MGGENVATVSERGISFGDFLKLSKSVANIERDLVDVKQYIPDIAKAIQELAVISERMTKNSQEHGLIWEELKKQGGTICSHDKILAIWDEVRSTHNRCFEDNKIKIESNGIAISELTSTVATLSNAIMAGKQNTDSRLEDLEGKYNTLIKEKDDIMKATIKYILYFVAGAITTLILSHPESFTKENKSPKVGYNIVNMRMV